MMNGHITLLGDYLDRLRADTIEHLAIVHIGYRKSVIARRICSGGWTNQTPFPARTIVADALNLGSIELLLAHNHPSGIAEPSASDLSETRDLSKILAALRIELTDHIIIAGNQHYSMRAGGLI